MIDGRGRRERLAAARLYLVCDARPGGRAPAGFLDAALRGGVDAVQLRDKALDDDALLAAAAVFREACAAHRALFLVNDRPDLAAAAGADGVHVGQDDVGVAAARAAVGRERLVGLSTHTPAQVDAARGVDYIACGPVHATPTKPGRPAVGTALLAHAAGHETVPFFAIGGLNAKNVEPVLAAGAERIVVVRAMTEAADPEAAARSLQAVIARGAGVGAA